MTWSQVFVRGRDPLPGPAGRALTAFYLARSASLIGDSAAAACLALLIFQRFGSVQALGAFFVARAAPRLLGPVLGSLSDRRDLRGLLRACDALSAVLYAIIAVLVPGLAVLLVLVVAAEIIAVISLPGTRTAVTRLLPEEQLTNATATVTAIAGLSTAAGAALGGLISAIVGARYGLALNALSFLGSALLMSTLPAMPPQPPQPAPARTGAPRGFRRLVVGFPVLLSSRIRILPLVLVIIAFGAALDRTALVVLSERVLTDGSSLTYGFAIGAVSIGVFLSAILVRRRPAVVGYPAMVVALALQGCSHALAGASPDAAALVLITLLIGFGNGLEVIVAMRLLQQSVDRSSLGAATGALLTSTTLLDAAGSALGAALLTKVSARAVFFIAGILMLTAAVPSYLSVRSRARSEGDITRFHPDTP